MLGVGAQSVLLCAHLVRIHRGEFDDQQASFARAARGALGFGFFLIITSGLAAVAVHFLQGRYDILFAPAFVFKWILISGLVGAYQLQKHLHAWSDLLAWLAGGSWYALFLVHSLAPIASWASLGMLYCAWMLFFGALWGVFVLIMRKRGVALEPQKVALSSVPIPKPQVAEMPRPAAVAATIVEAVEPKISWWKRLLLWAAGHHLHHIQPVPAVVVAPHVPPPPPGPKTQPPPPPASPVPPKPLVIPKPLPPPTLKPVAPPPPPPPKPEPLVVQHPPVPLAPAPVAEQPPVADEPYNPDVPALRIMPQRPEDISKAVRPAVVKSTKH